MGTKFKKVLVLSLTSILFFSLMVFAPTPVKAMTTETVDTDGKVGRYTSIALDSEENPYICYYDKSDERLKCAYKKEGEWGSEEVDTIGNISENAIIKTSIDIDGNDDPRISYYDKDDEKIEYAYKKEGSWSKVTVKENVTPGTMGGGVYTSLKIDENDEAHLSFNINNGFNIYLEYVKLDEKRLSNQSLKDLGRVSKGFSSLALDSDDEPNIVWVGYDESSEARLKYGYKDGNRWSSEIINLSEDVNATDPSVVMDGNEPHICFSDMMSSELFYGHKTGGDWSVSKVGKCMMYSSIDLNSEGEPYISYYDDNLELKLSWEEDDEWKKESVDTSSMGAGMFNSIEVDSEGTAHISYFHYNNKDLKYATSRSSEDVNDDGRGLLPGWNIAMFAGVTFLVSVVYHIKENSRKRKN